MGIFFNIISKSFPEIDVTRNAYENPPNRNNIINIDFIDYGFLNTLYHSQSHPFKRTKI